MNALAALAPFVRSPPPGVKRRRPSQGGRLAPAPAIGASSAAGGRGTKPSETRCQFCNLPIGADGHHAHVVDVDSRELLCACGACLKLAELEERGDAIGPHRPVPSRVLHDPSFHLDQAAWARLDIPVGLVFLFFDSRRARWVASYPCPGCAAESPLPADALGGVMEGWASGPELLQALRPDVEALLLHRAHDGSCEAFLVPIDARHRLVGRLRSHWQRCDGGDAIRLELDAFLEDLRRRARLFGEANGPGVAFEEARAPSAATTVVAVHTVRPDEEEAVS